MSDTQKPVNAKQVDTANTKPIDAKPVDTANTKPVKAEPNDEIVKPSDTSVQKIIPTPYKPPMSWYGVHDTFYRPFTFHDGRIDGSVWIQGNGMAITTEIEDVPDDENNAKIKLDMIPYDTEVKQKFGYELEDLKHKFVWKKIEITDKDDKKGVYYLIYKNYYPDLKVTEKESITYDTTELYRKKENDKKKEARKQRRENNTTNESSASPVDEKKVGGKDDSKKTVTGFLSNMFQSSKPKSKDSIEAVLQRISTDLSTVTDMVKKAKAKGAFPDEKPKEEPKDEVEIDPNTFVLWAVSFKDTDADFIEVYDFVVHSIKNKKDNYTFMDSEEYGVKMNENLLQLNEEPKHEDIYVYRKREIWTKAIFDKTLTWDAIGTYMKILKILFGIKLNYMKVVKKDANGNPLSVEEDGTPYIFVITTDTNEGTAARKNMIEDSGWGSTAKEGVEIGKSFGIKGIGATEAQTLDIEKNKLHELIDPDADENGASDDEDEKITTKYGGKGKTRRKHLKSKTKTFKKTPKN